MLIFTRYTYWAGAMLVLAVFLGVAGRAGLLDPAQDVFLRVTGPFEGGLSSTFRPVANFLDDVRDLDRLQTENRDLLVENETLRSEVAGLQSDALEIDELREALNITTGDPSAERLAAGVMSRTQGPLTNQLRIDKGTNDGVTEGNVVISVQGTLLGTVTRALAGSSFVRLVMDSRSSVAAQILGSTADGIVKGDGRDLSFSLVEGEVNVGDTIVTSGLGGTYPPDLRVGEVSEVLGDPQDPFPRVRIDPTVRISTTRTVLVITSFIPDRFQLDE